MKIEDNVNMGMVCCLDQISSPARVQEGPQTSTDVSLDDVSDDELMSSPNRQPILPRVFPGL